MGKRNLPYICCPYRIERRELLFITGFGFIPFFAFLKRAFLALVSGFWICMYVFLSFFLTHGIAASLLCHQSFCVCLTCLFAACLRRRRIKATTRHSLSTSDPSCYASICLSLLFHLHVSPSLPPPTDTVPFLSPLIHLHRGLLRTTSFSSSLTSSSLRPLPFPRGLTGLPGARTTTSSSSLTNSSLRPLPFRRGLIGLPGALLPGLRVGGANSSSSYKGISTSS